MECERRNKSAAADSSLSSLVCMCAPSSNWFCCCLESYKGIASVAIDKYRDGVIATEQSLGANDGLRLGDNGLGTIDRSGYWIYWSVAIVCLAPLAQRSRTKDSTWNQI